MLNFLTKRLREGYWTRGSVWEFDWYLDEFFAEVMSYSKFPFFLGYEQPILGDEYLDCPTWESEIFPTHKNFFKEERRVATLLSNQRKILLSAASYLSAARGNRFFSETKYETIQKNLSQLMASVSCLFDKLISQEVGEIAKDRSVEEEKLTNYILHRSLKTKLSKSNTELLKIYQDFKTQIERNKFQFNKLSPHLKQRLARHAKKYGWLNTGESGSAEWGAADFFKQMTDLSRTVNKTGDTRFDIKKLPPKHRGMIKSFTEINSNDNKAADMQIEMDYLFQDYLKERLGKWYIEPVIENLTYVEIISLLENPRSITSFEQRRNRLRAVWPENGKLAFHYFSTKREFAAVYKLVKDTKRPLGTITGRTACKGEAKGLVRIIRTQKDLSSFAKGEIMIAVKTQPKYVMAMSQAAAIVTDIGGITSHAAIISREFGIPCIVGTENATKILKNGDYVMVDADKGAVVKL